MISASGTLSSGGTSVRGCTSPSRSIRGVAKVDAQVARAVSGILALDQFAAQEERRGNYRIARASSSVSDRRS